MSEVGAAIRAGFSDPTPEMVEWELRYSYNLDCPDCWILEDGTNCPRHDAAIKERMAQIGSKQ